VLRGYSKTRNELHFAFFENILQFVMVGLDFLDRKDEIIDHHKVDDGADMRDGSFESIIFALNVEIPFFFLEEDVAGQPGSIKKIVAEH
jgi:hypothetical protein